MRSELECPTLINSIETLLVKEFRVYQALVQLTREERQALQSQNVPQLEEVLVGKERLLDEVEQLEEARVQAVLWWAEAKGLARQACSLADILPEVDEEIGVRLGRLRKGIIALAHELRDLSHGNRVLTGTALDRIDAVRKFIVEVESPALEYGPTGAMKAAPLSPALEMEQRA
jgi:flagellar biosynthesis/type III secretory pathway chaperone